MASGTELRRTFDCFAALEAHLKTVERDRKAKERRLHAAKVEKRERRAVQRDRAESAKKAVSTRAELNENIERFLVECRMHGRVGRGDYLQVPHGDARVTFNDKAVYPMEPIIRAELDVMLSRGYADQRPLLVDSSCGMATSWRRLAKIHPGADFVGVDVRAQADHEELPPDSFTYLQTDIRNLGGIQIPKSSTDKSFAGSVDLLFEQYGLTSISAYPEEVLAYYAGLLRPGGVAILSGPWPSTVITQSAAFAAREPPHVYQERFSGFVKGLSNLSAAGMDVYLPAGERGMSPCKVSVHELQEWQENPHALQRISDAFILRKPGSITCKQGSLYPR